MLRRSCAVLSLAASFVTSAACASDSACRFCKDGGASPRTLRDSYLAPCEAGTLRLGLTVTLPDDDTAGASGRGPPYPVVFFFNGFQARSGYYTAYARFLASWGYAVVQYDLPLFKIVEDSTELGFLAGLHEKLASDSQTPGHPLHQRLDLGRLGVAGHSRGGKIAALHLARNPRISAAYLLDPVDNVAHTPESVAYPSAAKALARSGRAAGVSGAAHAGICNPEGSNCRRLYEAAGGGSWLLVPARTYHTSFLDAGPLLNRLLDCLCCAGCGRGGASRRARPPETLQLTRPALLAWLERRLRPDTPEGEAAQLELAAWLREQHAAGRVAFEFKGPPAPGPSAAAGSGAQGNIVSLPRREVATSGG